MGSTRLFVTADCPDLIAFQRPQPYLKVLRREVTKEGGAHLSTRVGGSGKFSSHTVYADAPNGPSRCSSVATCGSLSAAFRYTRTGQHLGARLAGTVVVNFEGEAHAGVWAAAAVLSVIGASGAHPFTRLSSLTRIPTV